MASTEKFEAPECSLYINYVFFLSVRVIFSVVFNFLLDSIFFFN